jgi:hypothetical protein
MDFVPRSAALLLALDLHPDAPAVARLRSQWPPADVELLSRRAIDLAQSALDWTALDLDIEDDVSRWFGGRLVVASLGGPPSLPIGPHSSVLIASVTDTHRARADLDRAVSDLAREAGWRRSVARSAGQPVITWGETEETPAIAYAVADGCLLVSPSASVVARCLEVAETGADRLADEEALRHACASLPPDAIIWGYASTPHLPRPAPEPDAEAPAGALAFALTPEADGLRIHAGYWHPPSGEPREEGPDHHLADSLPAGATAFLLLRDVPRLLALWADDRTPPSRPPGMLPLTPGPLAPILQPDSLPDDLLLALLPPAEEGASPQLLVVFAGDRAPAAAATLSKLFPGAHTAEIGDLRAVATGPQALSACRRAVEDPASRHPVEVTPATALAFWVGPDALSRVKVVEEIEATVRRTPPGGSAEAYLRARPGRLLGTP